MEYEILVKMAEQASIALQEYFYKIIEEIDEIQENDFSIDLFDFQQILVTCQFTSESILILIGNGRMWDAEVLFRTLLEGTLKILYLSIGSDDDKKQKNKEFWVEQPNFNDIKRSYKAKVLLENLDKLNDDRFKLLKDVILDKDNLKKLRKKYPRKYRRSVESNWAFNNILSKLAKSNLNEAERLLGLTYHYFIASNLTHMDATAINMIRERNTRKALRRESVEITHGLRIINDILILVLHRLDCFRLYTNQEVDEGFKKSDIHKEIIEYYNLYQKEFEEIEKEYECECEDNTQ